MIVERVQLAVLIERITSEAQRRAARGGEGEKGFVPVMNAQYALGREFCHFSKS